MSDVVVVGGGLSGLAAATRLAALGHRVTLVEARDRLGGRWVNSPRLVSPIIHLPAAWRDLFRKTGKPLDKELSSRGLAMSPAPPATHHFTDGASIRLPSGRGDQYAYLSERLGPRTADRWRDLLDGLDRTWLALRRLGLEAPLVSPAQIRAHRKDLLWGRSVSDLAATLPPPLGHLVSATAYQIGSRPERTPAFVAARLAVERAFGRWYVGSDARALHTSALVDALVSRAETRGVQVLTATDVTGSTGDTVITAAGPLPASAVVTTTHPWHAPPVGEPRRRLDLPLRPALAPTVTVTHSPGIVAEPREEVRHTSAGPVVTHTVTEGDGMVTVSHDYTTTAPDPAAGARWEGTRSWLRRPGVRRGDQWWSATAAARGGNDPWAQILTAALVTYDIHATLTGEDVRPINKDYRPRVHRRRPE